MGFVVRVRRTLEQRRLLSRGRHLVVACSGGPDSSALLQALHEIAPAFGLTLTAAGVDHGLRPGARAELALVEALAGDLDIPFRELRVTVGGGEGRQAGARQARYRALLELAAELGAGHVATGHTLDDQAETVLARLLRSPSVRSLSGVQPGRADGVIRPLIDCRRADVERFVEQRGLRVARDPSNQDRTYTRSRVRHDLLPRLSAENPRLVEGLACLAADAAAHQALVEAHAPELNLGAAGARGALREHAGPIRRWLLGEWIAEQTGVVAGLEQLRALDSDREGAEALLAGGRVARWRADGSLDLDIVAKRTRGR